MENGNVTEYLCPEARVHTGR
uniref:Uncharacterized protein n=1 Tax=Anguilla anguilla TaxID=7936 RepID=A0A0E9TBH8_ANGAN